MKILVTGNQGYIGSVLVPVLAAKNYEVIGLDAGYYSDLIGSGSGASIRQIKKDIRLVDSSDLKGIGAIIHLAALSNDPLGEFDPALTDEINLKASIRLAELAKKSGASRFIYSSSQSMYGLSDSDAELEEDSSAKNPLTAYARTKWEAELALMKLNSPNFTVVAFRPSTVFGVSPKLRCDIVFNNLVACAYTTGKIEIKSDGTPWRPVVHVRDVCNAFIAGLEAPISLISGQAFNVGIKDGNYTVRDLAEAAQRSVPGSKLVFTGEHGKDSRTYKVSFKKILSVLKDWYKPEWDLDKGGKELVEFFTKTGFNENIFRGKETNRLFQLKYLNESKSIDDSFFWTK